MALLTNSYVSLNDFKDYFADTGTTDLQDDRVIVNILNGVSRLFDRETRGRRYYPRIETRRFSLPDFGQGWRSARTLRMDTDLLSVITLTNGNDVVVDPSYYYLANPNETPYWAIVLKETAGVIFQWDNSGNREYVVDVNGVWGMHDNYANAYETVSTLASGINVSVTSMTVATGTGSLYSVGQLLMIDDEWLACDGVSTDTITIRRAANGSTAAAHLTGTTVKVYRPMADVAEACKMIALNVYRRFGKNSGGTGDVAITGAGVVITPKDVSGISRSTIEAYKSRKLIFQY